jgi:hypothetical protein
MTGSRRYLAMGVLSGLSVWVRPDGLTLLGPAVLALVISNRDAHSRFKALEYYLIGFGSLFFAYLLFNLWVGGKPMPNTFYAKQAEYAAWQASPLFNKLGQLALQFLTGPSLVLLPGAAMWVISSWKRRDWGSLAAAAWFVGYVGLYTARLPLYQHGRYIMPAMPLFFLFGLLGFLRFLGAARLGRYDWFTRTLWGTGLAVLSLLFILLGARSYGQDVGLIESEMVDSARWASEHLPAGALIAAHDIGALGFFDDHPLLDLAGLISPEAVPFLRDEARLESFLHERGADYLISFPEFYPEMTAGREEVYTTAGEFSPKLGHENMVIYRWK